MGNTSLYFLNIINKTKILLSIFCCYHFFCYFCIDFSQSAMTGRVEMTCWNPETTKPFVGQVDGKGRFQNVIFCRLNFAT